MPAALQRNNFRCQPDGPKSPQAMAVMSVGVAAMGGSNSGGTFHAEYPARQRKRLQVGTTNLSKCSSFTEEGTLSSHGPAPLNPSAAIDRLCETNVGAMKATLDSPHRMALNYRPNASTDVMPLVLRTESRRMSPLSPTNSSRSNSSTDGRLDGTAISGTPRQRPAVADKDREPKAILALPEVHSSWSSNNMREDLSDGSRSPVVDNHRSEVNTTQMSAADDKKKLMMHNRAELYEVLMEKYGSMRAVFRAFDNDGNGMISAQRFQDMVEAAEVDLTPDETRALYQSADVNGDNTVAFQEFVHMFSPSGAAESSIPMISAYSPVKDPLAPVRDPSSSVAIKYRSPLQLSPRSRRRMRQLRKQVTDELYLKQGLALGVHGSKPEQLLSYAFKNVDSDSDGFLSYGEVEHALGRGFLQLENAISATDMREMLQLMDRNGDERISLREFVHYFAVGERDVTTGLLDNARKKELAALHAKRTVELTPREDVDPLFAQLRGLVQEQLSHVEPNSIEGCLPEQLCKRTAGAVKACNLIGSESPNSRSTNVAFDHKKSALSQTPSSLQLELDRRPATSCGTSGPTVSVLSSVSPDRFWHRRHERTDWTRVGIGGNGISMDTALFQSPQERFKTTSSETYSPLFRAPPSFKADNHDGSFTILGAAKSLTTVEEDARRGLRAARYERTQIRLQEYEEVHVQAGRLKDWKSRANIRKVAGERFNYLDRLQEREHRVTVREDRMQRRHGGASFLRMWAGSSESQFNTHHKPNT